MFIAIMQKGSAGTTPTVNALAGWNELLDEAQTLGLYIAWRTCDGTEGTTTTFTLSSSTRGAWIVYEISGQADPTVQAPQVGTTASGSGTTPDPPSVSVTGGSKDILTIACFGRDGEEADDDTWVTSAPSGFGGLLQKACGTAGTNLAGMIATAHLASTTATSNPGTFSAATGAWRAQTIVVHPVVPSQTAVAEVSLGAGSTPATRTAHSIKVRARTTAGAGTLRAALYEGATNRSGDLESSALTTSLADYTLAIPDASAANITDYSNLGIRFWGYAAGGGSIVFEVDQLYLEIPASAGVEKTGFGKAGGTGGGADVMLDVESGRGVAGTVGAGASASLTQETGFGTSGLVGVGSSASLTQETGFGTVGGNGFGTASKATTYAKSGFAAVGLVGSGPSASVMQETGFATAGLVGSGASSSINQESGFGTVGTVGSGASAFVSGAGNVYTKAGFGTAGDVGSGADVDVAAETGRGVAGLVGSGADVAVSSETGRGVVGSVGSGSSERSRIKSGYATVGTVGSGSKTRGPRIAAAGLVWLFGDALQQTGFNDKTGHGVAGLVGSGVSASVSVESGAGVVGSVGSGVASSGKAVTKTGFAVAGLVGSGAGASVTQETGAGVVGAAGFGASASVTQETGFGTVGGVGSGVSARAGVIVKAGAGVAGLVGAGRDVMVDTERGAGIVGAVGAGVRNIVDTERGFGKVGAVGSGSRSTSTVYTKAGFGKVGTVGSGGRVRERSSSGYGTVGTIAAGTKLRVLTRTGTAILTLVGAGSRNMEFAETGYATVNGDGYGSVDVDVFLTLLSPIHTGRIADGWNGSVDGGDLGHIADTVAGVMDEDLEEVFV
jgi:hypothetical protein